MLTIREWDNRLWELESYVVWRIEYFLFPYLFLLFCIQTFSVGSYHLCYPRPGLICHHELVGVMADLVPS